MFTVAFGYGAEIGNTHFCFSKEGSVINQDTYSKLEVIRRIIEQVDEISDNVCPRRPNSLQLIEWAEDIYQYYYNLYPSILITFETIN